MRTLLENLKPFMRCPVCRKKYAPVLALPITDEEGQATVHLTCPSCRISSMVFISENPWGIASVGVLTDLKSEEAKQYFGKDVISLDAVLDTYTSLKTYHR